MSNFNFDRLPRWLRDLTPLVCWMALIFFLSDQPILLEIDNEAGEKTFYKTAHIVAYAVLAWLWWRALAPQRQISGPVLSLVFVLTVLYGISDEIHQLFVPGRHGRVADVLFDTSGTLLMILLLRWFKWLRFFPETFLWPYRGKSQPEF